MKRVIHVVKQYDVVLKPFYPNFRKTGFILVGVAIGMLLAYILVPTQYKNNAEPAQMDDTYREQWVNAAAVEFSQTGDVEELQRKLVAVGYTSDDVKALQEKQGAPSAQLLAPVITVAERTNSQAEDQAKTYSDPGTWDAIAPLVVFILTIVVGLLLSAYLTVWPDPVTFALRWWKKRQSGPTAVEIEQAKRAAASKLEKSVFDTPPVVQFMSTYMAGDNFYDDSFPIETEDDKFLGECGSAIAESITDGDSKKVVGTEVWMFSQNDIATLTHVMLSPKAFNDEALKAKLAVRGTPVLAEPGATTILEAKSLKMQVRVVEVKYDANEAFEQLTVELAVWEAEGAGTGASSGEPTLPPPVITPPPMQQQAPPAAPPQQSPPMQAPAQQPPAQKPMQQPPQQQPMAPPPAYSPPPAQQPMQQPPQRAPQQPQMRPPQEGGGGRQAPPSMQPPQMRPPSQGSQPPQQPPSPFGDTNY